MIFLFVLLYTRLKAVFSRFEDGNKKDHLAGINNTERGEAADTGIILK